QTSWTVTVPVVADKRKEGSEQIGLFVTGSPTVVYEDGIAVGTITDDD
ncbi:MAG: hypothetical protein HOV79_33025, partial [Hamadaea sp.]|nr:hypothetical protein [Hamadaea sp.]